MSPEKESLKDRASKVFTTALGRYSDLEIEKAKGVYLYGRNGKRYLDFSSGIATTNTGHCHPAVVRAVEKQIRKLIHICAGVAFYEPHIALAEELLRHSPEGLDRVFLCQSGSEAVEAALKLARYTTQKPGVLAFHGSFHGRTFGALSVTASKEKYTAPYKPLLQDVFFVPFPSEVAARHAGKELEVFLHETIAQIEQTVQVHHNTIGAVIVEPIQGEGGYNVPHPRFLQKLREITKTYGILLILDEVQTGAGRTGKMFAFQHFGIVPDIVALAKGLGSGMPVAAMMGRKDLMTSWPPSAHGSTLGGNPVCTAAGLATLRVLKGSKLPENAHRMGRRLMLGLKKLQTGFPFIRDVRGMGLMIGVEIYEPKTGKSDPDRVKAIRAFALKKGLMLISCGVEDEVIRFVPPLTISAKDIDKGLSIFQDALKNH